VDISSTSDQTTIWATKPWWCQPWSILLTGITLPLVSWLWFNSIWLTFPLAGIVLLWWVVFLVLVPQAYRKESLTLKAKSANSRDDL
jgi:hypothetical protein